MSICRSSRRRPASAPAPLYLLSSTTNHERRESTDGKCDKFQKSEAAHLRGEHGDVVKLSTPSLFDRHRQEESAAIFGEHRFLVLEDTQRQKAPFDEDSSRLSSSDTFLFKAVSMFNP